MSELHLGSTDIPLSVASRDEPTTFDIAIQKTWDHHMKSGHFRYEFRSPQSRLMDGHFGYVAQLNPNRATKRRYPEEMLLLKQPFDPKKFNFTKIDEKKELVVELNNDDGPERDIIVTNVSPLEYGHCLLVPDVNGALPQVLTQRSIRTAIRVALSSGQKNLKMAFNSLCAYASVNHQHWHLYYLEKHRLKLETCQLPPLCDGCFQIRRDIYPAEGFAFQLTTLDDLDKVIRDVFRVVDYLTENDIGHNVFMTRGCRFDLPDAEALRIFVWAREKVVGTKIPDAFVIAVCELAGQILVYNEEKYRTISEDEIKEEQIKACGSVYQKVKSSVIQLMTS